MFTSQNLLQLTVQNFGFIFIYIPQTKLSENIVLVFWNPYYVMEANLIQFFSKLIILLDKGIIIIPQGLNMSQKYVAKHKCK